MGITDGASCASTRPRLPALAASFCVAAAAVALTLASSTQAKSLPAGTTAFHFHATKVHGHVATFNLRGIVPESIRNAYLERGHERRSLSLARVRAAARHGVLRLHIASSWAQPGHEGRVSRHRTSRRKKTTLVVITNPPPPVTPGPPKPAPGPAPGPVTSWRAVGSPPLSDAAAKALVVPRAEIRPANSSANRYVPNGFELAGFHNAGSFNPLERYVSAGFTGTTDEILKWGAHKWGIPEDVLRAVAVTESWWRQSAMGDRRDGVDASLYPAQSRIDAVSVYETLGLMQIKWRPDGSLHPGTEPLRWKSTAFSVDYWGATVRYYYDGLCDWCGSGYGPGQAWESIGAHYDPLPWRNAGMLDYIATVKGHVADRTWERPGF